MTETLDLEPEWEELAKYFDQKAEEARKEGRQELHAKFTDLAERAENENLTKKEVFMYL